MFNLTLIIIIITVPYNQCPLLLFTATTLVSSPLPPPQLAAVTSRSAAMEAAQAEAVAESQALLRLVEEGADEEVHELKQRCGGTVLEWAKANGNPE